MPIDEARPHLRSRQSDWRHGKHTGGRAVACTKGADYIGCGPFRFTTTKEGLSPVLGLEGYLSITEGMRQHGISLPVVAIGGITLADIGPIMQTAVTDIALSGTILRADNPVDEMKKIVSEMNRNKQP